MARGLLFQAEISKALRNRVLAVREKFRLSNAELLRIGLEMACEKLEPLESPYPPRETPAPNAAE